MLYLNHSLIKERVLKMENYKIKVNNEAESKEAQELFFELGYYWATGLEVKNLDAKFLYAKNNKITMGYCSDHFSDVGYREITIEELRDMASSHRKPTEQDLISGADALRALADGKELEFKDGMNKWENIKHHMNLDLSMFLTAPDWMSFRLKPRTIKLELEIPAPFEPKDGDRVWFICDDNDFGYAKSESYGDDIKSFYGWWRTEEEIKQVVAALRGALKNG